jgi:2-deoxy-D-gluconate 3-dehydrogenase
MILDKFKLDDQWAVVTGNSRGIGQAIAFAFAEAGANIVGIDIETPRETADKIEALGRRHLWKQADLLTAAPDSLSHLVKLIIAETGHIDILVNNAGINYKAGVFEYDLHHWNDLIQMNLNSPWFLARAVAKHMVERKKGKIISIASIFSHQGGIDCPGYVASKHAVRGFTKAMANELARQGVNVNTISPGYIHTRMTSELHDNPQYKVEARIPARRWGTPKDVQGAALLLASSAGDYIHGADIVVDGGWLGF